MGDFDIGAVMNGLFDFLSQNAGDLLQGGIGAYGYKNLMDSFEDQRDALPGQLDAVRSDLTGAGEFKPFGVRSAVGSSYYNPNSGMMDNTLTAPQQGFSDAQRMGANTMFGRATMDPAARETDVYNRIREMQRPGEERAHDRMQAGLFSSGRGGMMSSGFGGSPEEFAFQKAQAEARNQASLQAMGQAQNEMQNYANIGNSMATNQYLPYQTLGNQTGQGIQTQQLRTQAGGNLGNQLAQLGLGGITTDMNYANARGGAFGELINALGGALGGIS